MMASHIISMLQKLTYYFVFENWYEGNRNKQEQIPEKYHWDKLKAKSGVRIEKILQ